MESTRMFVVIFMLAAQINFVMSQKVEKCTAKDIEIVEKYTITDGAVTLPKTSQKLTLKTLANKNCILTVTAYKMMQIEMAVVKADFKDECTNAYLTAGNSTKADYIKVCKLTVPKDPLFSTDGMINLEAKTSNNEATVEMSFKFTQRLECGSPLIVLSKEIESVTFPMNMKKFTKESECNIEVKRDPARSFKMTVTDIDLYNGECNNDYFAASLTQITEGTMLDKKCQKNDVNYTLSAPDGKMFLQILTGSGQDNAKVALQFTTDFPECGTSEIEIAQEIKEITLPPKDQTFKKDTLCNLRVFNKNSTNFALTITKIDFATGNCQDDYVSASLNSQLPNATYLKCGTDPVTDPFVSVNGEMFLQLKTKTFEKDKSVTFKFEPVSGACKPGRYTVMAIFLFNLLSKALCYTCN